MARWAYCAISYLDSSSTREAPLVVKYPLVKHFSSEARRPQGFDVREGWADISQAVADLGDARWEMVGCNDVTPACHLIWFKRPKE